VEHINDTAWNIVVEGNMAELEVQLVRGGSLSVWPALIQLVSTHLACHRFAGAADTQRLIWMKEQTKDIHIFGFEGR